MDFKDLVKKRRSVRKYLSKKVDYSIIGQILDAGRHAPSAGNLQPWSFVVVQNEDKKKELADAALKQYWIMNAPILIVVCARTKNLKRFYGKRGEMLYSIQDCAACIENMLLMATELGLGSCWVGAFDEGAISRILKLPDDVRAQAIVALGYSKEEASMPRKYELDYLAHFGEWKGKAKKLFPISQHIPEKVPSKGLVSLFNKLKKKK